MPGERGKDKGDGIDGVLLGNYSGDGVKHELGVAMIRSEGENTIPPQDGVGQAVDFLVDDSDGLASRLEISGMTNHVGISIIDDDNPILFLANRLDGSVGHLRGGHFRMVGELIWGERFESLVVLVGEC